LAIFGRFEKVVKSKLFLNIDNQRIAPKRAVFSLSDSIFAKNKNEKMRK
jgi:hypothetical protein